ncbi:hypothetical protein B0T24DRAFT_416542 [Lasiosphaeria ovina]|uniref:Uncharacterized protein n=1 Tax=Lasiosphaeria ovina TaxID=92902 RepID=A0AAE0JYE4_9PEZI|nr:hypothetical protein B0T24DRAFT_416542 [Lasiosphaeria ovina]
MGNYISERRSAMRVSFASLRQDVERALAAAVTGDLDSITTRNNAPLDPQTIARLATGIVASNPVVTKTTDSATPEWFRVQYRVAGAALCPVEISISHHTAPLGAQNSMRMRWETSTHEVDVVTTKTAVPLGQASLQTGLSVDWVRDAVHVEVEAGPTFYPQPARQGPVPPPPDTQPPPRTPTPPSNPTTDVHRHPLAFQTTRILETLLLPLAQALDGHLAAHAVLSAEHITANTAMQTTAYRGVEGKELAFKLADTSGLNAIRSVAPVATEAGARNNVILAPAPSLRARGGPAAVPGEYRVLPHRTGKGLFRLLVYRTDTLAVGTAVVDVEILGRENAAGGDA